MSDWTASPPQGDAGAISMIVQEPATSWSENVPANILQFAGTLLPPVSRVPPNCRRSWTVGIFLPRLRCSISTVRHALGLLPDKADPFSRCRLVVDDSFLFRHAGLASHDRRGGLLSCAEAWISRRAFPRGLARCRTANQAIDLTDTGRGRSEDRRESCAAG